MYERGNFAWGEKYRSVIGQLLPSSEEKPGFITVGAWTDLRLRRATHGIYILADSGLFFYTFKIKGAEIHINCMA